MAGGCPTQAHGVMTASAMARKPMWIAVVNANDARKTVAVLSMTTV